jgi:hypothetical protein
MRSPQKSSTAATAAANGSPAALCLPTCVVSAASVLPAQPAGTRQQPLDPHVPAAPVQLAAAHYPSQQQQRQTCMHEAQQQSNHVSVID